MRTSGLLIVVPIVGCLLCAAVSAQVTQRVSVASNGAQGDGSSRAPSISADGRWVAFESAATNLVPGDTNAASDIFVRDRQSGATERASVSSLGMPGNGDSTFAAISADGRYVAFVSLASNLISGDTNAASDIFVHDRVAGTTERVSIDSGAVQANSDCFHPSISTDGRFVAFASTASNLVPGDTNLRSDDFVHDRATGTTERVSVSTAGTQGDAGSDEPVISADGRWVAFDTVATNLAPGDTNSAEDVYLHDRMLGTTERVSVSTSGAEGNSISGQSSLSDDGRYIVFYSVASNLVAGDTNGAGDLFVRDRIAGATERVSVDSGGGQADGESIFGWISGDGRRVSFMSHATNLVPGDTNGVSDIFVHDRQTGATERVSVATGGAQGDLQALTDVISADGRYVAFGSQATDLVGGDTNAAVDVFVQDSAATGFEVLCEPGVGGVIACPCANPPSSSGRGCDNSASTGGAVLAASGIAYLSMDSLVFTTNSERATATSIVMQGTTMPPAGIVYGQGVRCVGGALERLFTKTAVAGSITAPDFGAGDPTVSARSAAKGDVIQPGQSRWYLAYYRDPIVLGGCPATSTFNATQTGQVSWWP